MSAIEKIRAQQASYDETTPEYMVGEQMIDMIRETHGAEELLDADLKNPDMSLKKAAAKIKAWADAHKGKSTCVCVPPKVADGILREFYGLPGAGAEPAKDPAPEAEAKAEGIIDLLDLI